MHDFEIEETIYHTADWPDHTYERIYRASYAGNRAITLGDFEDESQTGIVHTPIVIGNRLILFTSATVYVWRPGEEPIHFNPFVAEGWYEYSQKEQLNGHYDFLARNVLIKEEEWLIQYECIHCQPQKPEGLLFVSTDDGHTFDVCLNPVDNFSRCAG